MFHVLPWVISWIVFHHLSITFTVTDINCQVYTCTITTFLMWMWQWTTAELHWKTVYFQIDCKSDWPSSLWSTCDFTTSWKLTKALEFIQVVISITLLTYFLLYKELVTYYIFYRTDNLSLYYPKNLTPCCHLGSSQLLNVWAGPKFKPWKGRDVWNG